MAEPTLTLLNYTSITTAEATTNWTLYDTLDTDIKKEGSNSITGTFKTDLTVGYYDHASAPATAVGKTFRKWINTTNLPYMKIEANGGYELLCYDGTTTEYKTMFGSDTYAGGWFNVVWDMDTFTTLTLANVQRWGVRINHNSSAKQVDNIWTDAFKYLDGYSMTGGSASPDDPITLAEIADADKADPSSSPEVDTGYGVLLEVSGAFFCTGEMQFGTGATATYVELDGDILIFEDKPVASGLYSLSGVGSGTNVTIQNSYITSAGLTDDTRYAFDWSDTNLASFTCTGNSIVRAAACTFKSGQTVTGNIFDNCGQIAHGGADMDNCTVKNYVSTASPVDSALVYNVNADPDGEMDGMTFEKGDGTAHAIEFGLTSPTTMTLRDVTCTGYNASDSQPDSTFHFKRTSGSVTLYLNGFTGNYSYLSDGADITIVPDPVTVKVTATTTDGTPIENVLVLLEATSGSPTGPFPVQASVTIARTGSPESLAIVSHNSHGMASNDYVVIRGANQAEYNGTKQIIVIDANSYSFVTDSSPLPVTPATGTITATFAALYGLTDVNGEISTSRVYSSNQPVLGWGRKMSGTPYYKEGVLTGFIDSTTGYDKSAVMALDE